MNEEELSEKIRSDRIQKQRAEILKVQQDAFEKQEKYWMQYQEVGNSSSKRTADKYEQLAEICGLALQELSTTCERCNRRRRNGYHTIKQLRERREQLGENNIPIDEAINLIGELL